MFCAHHSYTVHDERSPECTEADTLVRKTHPRYAKPTEEANQVLTGLTHADQGSTEVQEGRRVVKTSLTTLTPFAWQKQVC